MIDQDTALEILNDAFDEHGPDEPELTAGVEDGPYLRATIYDDEGDAVEFRQWPFVPLPVPCTKERYLAFATGCAKAATATAEEADGDAFYEACEVAATELLTVESLQTAEDFEKAALGEDGLLDQVLADTWLAAYSATHGLPKVADPEMRRILHDLALGEYRVASEALDKIVAVYGEGLGPQVGAIVAGWAADPEAWKLERVRPDAPSGPRILATRVRQKLLPELSKEDREPVEAALDSFDWLPSPRDLEAMKIR